MSDEVYRNPNYQSPMAGAVSRGNLGMDAAAGAMPDKVANMPRLEAIANQLSQAHEALHVLTNRAQLAADKLMGARPPTPSKGEAVEGGDHSSTHRLQRHARELFAMIERLAVEIQRLEEL